jgi:hypothetical protein
MPNKWWKATMGGTVDSPTPTVPISSDSTSVMSSSLPNCVDSVIAGHPAGRAAAGDRRLS